jgi:hypothetical protein
VTAQALVGIVGGIVCVILSIGFARSIRRKPPDKPGSPTDTGGLPPRTA